MLKIRICLCFALLRVGVSEASVVQWGRLACLHTLGLVSKKNSIHPVDTKTISPSDFPVSRVGQSKGYDPGAYAQWAAGATASTANDFGKVHPELILEKIRKSYRNYGIALGRDVSLIRFRLNDNSVYVRSHIGLKIKDSSQAEEGEDVAMANYALIVNNVEQSLGGFNYEALYLRREWNFAANPFQLSEGNVLFSGLVMLHSNSPVLDTIIYRSPGAWDAKPAFQLLMKRVDELARTEWNRESRLEWLRLMRGYFMMMPFYSGSAGIGRVYFTSLAHKMRNGVAISLPPDIDIQALTLSEDNFLRFYEASMR